MPREGHCAQAWGRPPPAAAPAAPPSANACNERSRADEQVLGMAGRGHYVCQRGGLHALEALEAPAPGAPGHAGCGVYGTLAGARTAATPAPHSRRVKLPSSDQAAAPQTAANHTRRACGRARGGRRQAAPERAHLGLLQWAREGYEVFARGPLGVRVRLCKFFAAEVMGGLEVLAHGQLHHRGE